LWKTAPTKTCQIAFGKPCSCDVNALNAEGLTPLQLAVVVNQVQLVDLMLAQKTILVNLVSE